MTVVAEADDGREAMEKTDIPKAGRRRSRHRDAEPKRYRGVSPNNAVKSGNRHRHVEHAFG